MILSHKYRFIFIKTGKTAGTSIEIALSRFCGPDDIITPDTKEDDALRQSLGYPGPQNYEAPLSEYGLRDYLRLYRKKKARFYDHMTAIEIRKHVGDEIWNSYYKFCVVRNPWDRFVSAFYWNTKHDTSPDMDAFLESHWPKRSDRTISLYTIDGEIAVDKVCRFEKLQEDLEEVRQHLGIPEPLELPRAKGTVRKDKRHYRDILTEEQKNHIAEICQREIELFGYRF